MDLPKPITRTRYTHGSQACQTSEAIWQSGPLDAKKGSTRLSRGLLRPRAVRLNIPRCKFCFRLLEREIYMGTLAR